MPYLSLCQVICLERKNITITVIKLQVKNRSFKYKE